MQVILNVFCDDEWADIPLYALADMSPEVITTALSRISRIVGINVAYPKDPMATAEFYAGGVAWVNRFDSGAYTWDPDALLDNAAGGRVYPKIYPSTHPTWSR